jgi:hypothetical protein
MLRYAGVLPGAISSVPGSIGDAAPARSASSASASNNAVTDFALTREA